MNFVSRQAQEVILNPILPESYKDEVLMLLLRRFKVSQKGKLPITPNMERVVGQGGHNKASKMDNPNNQTFLMK